MNPTPMLTDMEMHAIRYAAYIANARIAHDDAAVNEFTEEERNGCKRVAMNALTRNIIIYNHLMEGMLRTNPNYQDHRTMRNNMNACLDKIMEN